ncbi:MAG: Nitrogen fixation regulatory protein [Candidatus Celerinatantimonas neptuna]|nr:MAG: Nitrogen fixation regulatory protein [Candidatus Celerinatantimonas neptuna]
MAEIYHPFEQDSPLKHQFSELLDTLPIELFLQVVDQAPIAISMTDLNANICYANQRFSELTGYSLPALKGQNQRMLSSLQTPRACYQQLWSTIQSGQTWSGRLVNRTRKGRDYLAELTIAPVFGEDGQMTHFIGIQRDVSESYQLTQELTNQKAHFEAVLNSSDNLIVVFDEADKVVLDNLAYKTLQTDLDGIEPLDFIRQQLAGQHQLSLNDLLSEHHPIVVEYWIRGNKQWLSLDCQPLVHVDEKVSHYFNSSSRNLYILVGQDCTAQQQLHIQHHIEKLRGQLSDHKMLAAIRETLQTAIYQLSQPINLLYAAARLDASLTAPSKALNEVLTSAEQALQSLKANIPRLKPEPVRMTDIDQISEDFILLARSRARQLVVQLDIAPPVGGLICVQRVSLLNALDLVIEHALIASLKGGDGEHDHYPGVAIHFMIEEGSSWLVQIEDNGPLLPMDDSHRIMQPFYNRESLRDELGLGLSLARDIVLDHGGTMDIVPIVGGGSQVIVTIPLHMEVNGDDSK